MKISWLIICFALLPLALPAEFSISNMPHQATLRVPNLDIREKPAFEYRGPYWFPGFEPQWKARNGANNETWEVPKELGGCVKYKGFCHTFYPLVPPEKYFAEHPE